MSECVHVYMCTYRAWLKFIIGCLNAPDVHVREVAQATQFFLPLM